ncbi:MAG: NADH-quinone oxidoreductase subunit L [Desulfurococcales archaeon]|nr:NADH-quinone oxidoreductase subunit L [Desulfurococcales archaeon]
MIDPIWIWLTPYLGALALAILWISGVRDERIYGGTAVGSILISALIATILTPSVYHGHLIYTKYSWLPSLGINFGTYMDGLGAFMALVVSWLSLLIAIYSTEYMKGDWGVQRYFFFFTFFVGSMLLLVLADNLVLMFIGWEGTGLASYALIGHWYTDEEETWVGDPGRKAFGTPMYFEPSHSGVRAILFTRVGDIGMIIGMALFYMITGTFNIPQISETATGWMSFLASKGVLTAALLVFSLGALAKSAQFPFHEWLVTAMTGPTPVSALIHAATMVKAGVYFMLRFSPIFYNGAEQLGGVALAATEHYFNIIALLGGVTAFMMATMALVSRELKLIFAFSTASQLGYMFLGVGAAGLLAQKEMAYEGIAASAAHLMSHAIFKAALFLIAGWAIHAVHSRFIDNMGNFSKYMKITTLSIWLAGLSLAGLPPFSGFWSKEGVIHAAQAAHLENLWFLAVFTAGLTGFYTTRAIIRVFHMPPYEPPHHEAELHEAPPRMLWPYTILAFTALIIGLVWPFGFGADFSNLISKTLGFEEPVKLAVEFNATTYGIITWVLAMVLLVPALYLVMKVDFVSILKTSKTARILHDFLYDRWYINALIYIIIVGGFIGAIDLLGYVDGFIDAFYHIGIPIAFILISKGFRSMHKGRPDLYLAYYAYGIGLLLLMLYLIWG